MNILITGSRRGIGRALTEHFLKLGHRIYGCSLRATDLVHSQYTHSELDISKANQVRELFESLRKSSIHLDACFNCAAIAGMNHFLLTPPQQAQNIVETNLLGAFYVTQEAARSMTLNGGLILHFSTIAVRLDLEGECAYASSKAGVETLVRIVAKELEPMRIRVNAIALGPVATDLIRNVPKDKIDKLIVASQRTNMISNEEIFAVVEQFINNPGSTGQIVNL